MKDKLPGVPLSHVNESYMKCSRSMKDELPVVPLCHVNESCIQMLKVNERWTASSAMSMNHTCKCKKSRKDELWMISLKIYANDYNNNSDNDWKILLLKVWINDIKLISLKIYTKDYN